ncbi:hypothetical protein [Tabrizicola sp.]|uniref:hypothetical protein n=1 Tax=Tabrizicola sp. TaxID=2005166 RepID=UPI001A4F64FC|nr:hypothetical protein [Tabrizicola sp.]MBL9072507.1 hypothetical protein [Tabrizicola sp.]
MRYALGAFLIGLFVFVLVADESPASFFSKLKATFSGPDYAHQVFRGRIPIHRVLASYDSLPSDWDAPRCRVAVVEIAVDAPAKPPRIALIDQDSSRFGGNWRPSPLSSAPPATPDLIDMCGDLIDGFSRRSLQQALSEPGAFFIRDWKNNVLQIYAPKAGLAAHLMLEAPWVAPSVP